jgi:Na+/melibiose symporter-like transporter
VNKGSLVLWLLVVGASLAAVGYMNLIVVTDPGPVDWAVRWAGTIAVVAMLMAAIARVLYRPDES